MISLITNVNKFQNDIADMIRPFYGFNEIVYEEKKEAKINIIHNHKEMSKKWKEIFSITKNNSTSNYTYDYIPGEISDDIKYKRQVKRSVKFGAYYALRKAENKTLPWGALTGIRPVSFFRMMRAAAVHEICLKTNMIYPKTSSD